MPATMKGHPVCEHPDGRKCFANVLDNQCSALRDCHFNKGKRCPFFKEKEKHKTNKPKFGW